jgi:hypothetical protein
VYYEGNEGTDKLDMLANLADGTYEGLNSEGYSGDDELPVLDGKITLNANAYEDTVTALQAKFSRLELVISGEWYIRFADSVVGGIVISNWGDGTGITRAMAAKVTSLNSKFKGNTNIKYFDELKYFTNMVKIASDEFNGCSSLETIDLTNITTLGAAVFFNCTSLLEAYLPNLSESSNSVFYGCSSLKIVRDLGSIKVLSRGYWSSKYWGYFQNCTSLEEVYLPETIVELERAAFYDCKMLTKIHNTEYIEKVGQSAFVEVAMDAYSKDGSVIPKLDLSNCTTLDASSPFDGAYIDYVYLPKLVSLTGGYFNNNIYCNGSFSGYRGYTMHVRKVYLRDVTEIGAGTFANNNALKVLIIDNINPPTLASMSFGYSPMPNIYVPDGYEPSYKTADGWSSYADYIHPLSELDEEY